MQSDPIGLNAGPNTYTYVKNDPLTIVDYFGLASGNSGFGGYSYPAPSGTYYNRNMDRPYIEPRIPPRDPDLNEALREGDHILEPGCGPGCSMPQMRRCVEWACQSPNTQPYNPNMCTPPQGGPRTFRYPSLAPMMTPRGWSPERDPTCRCLRSGWIGH